MRTSACLAESLEESREKDLDSITGKMPVLRKPRNGGRKGRPSVWENPELKAIGERLIRAGLTGRKVIQRLEELFGVSVSQSQIFRLRRQVWANAGATDTEAGEAWTSVLEGIVDEEDSGLTEGEVATVEVIESSEKMAGRDAGRHCENASTFVLEDGDLVPFAEGPSGPCRSRMGACECGQQSRSCGRDETVGPASCRSIGRLESLPHIEPDKVTGKMPALLKPRRNEGDTRSGRPPRLPETRWAGTPTATNNGEHWYAAGFGLIESRQGWPSKAQELMTREAVQGCQLPGHPRQSRIACLKRQVSSGKRYIRNDHGVGPLWLNSPYQACRGCGHFLNDKEYKITKKLVKSGLKIEPMETASI